MEEGEDAASSSQTPEEVGETQHPDLLPEYRVTHKLRI